ncbi:MAG: hypothetical protein WCL50_14910, partial [Spirochaetota bacterium]
DAEIALPSLAFSPIANESKEPDNARSAATAETMPEPAPLQLAARDSLPRATTGPSSALSSGAHQAFQDPHPDESRDQLLERLEAYLGEHAEAFTDRHYEWVMDKAHKAKDREGVLKMLSYSTKVVRNEAAAASASA